MTGRSCPGCCSLVLLLECREDNYHTVRTQKVRDVRGSNNSLKMCIKKETILDINFVGAGISRLLPLEILWLPRSSQCGHWKKTNPSTAQENVEQKQNYKKQEVLTHSEAVNTWLLLAARLLMGLSCPRTSPRGASESACQRRSSPPLHPLSSTGEPGTTPRTLTQSAWMLAD